MRAELDRTLHGIVQRHDAAVCQAWREDPAAFAAWAVANGYQPGKKLWRHDTAKGYDPDNCFWSSMKRQAHTDIFLAHDGKTQSLTEWARETGIKYDTIYYRYIAGKAPAEVLSTAPLKKGRTKHTLTASGRTQSWADWSRETGIPYETIRGRVCAGWPDHKVLGLAE